MKSKLKIKFSTLVGKLSSEYVALIVVLVVGAVGTVILVISHAATPYSSTTADAGTVVSAAVKQTCSGANDGNCVVFGATTTSTSTSKPTVVGHALELGTTGSRLEMRGVAVWGIQDQITGTFGVDQYNDRQAVVNTVKAWGGNEIRLRVLASNYQNQTYMTQAQELQEIKDWQTTAQAAGLYVGITWWDSLDGAYNDANWASDYSKAFPMMTAVVNELGATNPWVFYEPFNEPNNVSEGSWLSAMVSTDQHFRAAGYTGILVLDTDGWSHVYNDSDMTTIENDDATLLKGQNQIIFAKHDYANEYPNTSTFDNTAWLNNDDGSTPWNTSKHLVWETEFGNYNGSASTVNNSWSSEAASGMATNLNNGTIVGATAFLFGPWYDANAMTASDNVTPTQWGGYVENNFLKKVD